jgi:hypothetical protein
MPYTIIISEEQRVALLQLISNSSFDLRGRDQPLEYWVDMLTDLPKVESENPGVHHGFCL